VGDPEVKGDLADRKARLAREGNRLGAGFRAVRGFRVRHVEPGTGLDGPDCQGIHETGASSGVDRQVDSWGPSDPRSRRTVRQVIQVGRRRLAIDRSRDRMVVALAIAAALVLLAAALASTLLPSDVRHGVWLPIHLALAGGASTAIAGVVPFFAAAFAAAPPAGARLRLAAVIGVAAGATFVASGVVGGLPWLAAAGGATFVAGVCLTAIAMVRPLRRALGPNRGPVTQGYAIAFGEVAVGATIATFFVAGWPPVIDSWAQLKPAHAWLNLVGFVSLVIATTLLHFFPTVSGARIAVRLSARLTVLGLALGPALVALAFALASDVAVRVGAGISAAGALALLSYVSTTWRSRGHWTTDLAWHRFAIGGLASAIVWFEIGIGLAVANILLQGAAPDAWSVGLVVGPLVVGWMGMAVLASATHLLPAVGPGDQTRHSRQRVVLGRYATARLVLADAGIAGFSVGYPLALPPLTAVGLVLIAIAFVTSGALLATALALGIRGRT
jgi:nitrite reductase (NO-forming)